MQNSNEALYTGRLYRTGRLQSAGQNGCRIGRLHDRSIAGKVDCRTGRLQDMSTAGQVGCRTARQQGRSTGGQVDTIQDGCRIGQMQDRTDEGQDRSSAGRVTNRKDAGQDGLHVRSYSIQDHICNMYIVCTMYSMQEKFFSFSMIVLKSSAIFR